MARSRIDYEVGHACYGYGGRLMWMPQPISQDAPFYGDNLDIPRECVPANSVDLVYLDPPFNSARNHNVLSRDRAGKYSDAQIEAFEDT